MSNGNLRLVPGVVKPVRTERPIYFRIVLPIALVVALCGLLWFLRCTYREIGNGFFGGRSHLGIFAERM